MHAHRWRFVGMGIATVLAITLVVVGGSGHLGVKSSASADRGVEDSVKDPLSGYSSWFYGQRAFPAKHVPAGALAAATRKALRMSGTASGTTSGTTGGAWTNLGPAPTNQDAAPYTDPVWSNYGGGIGDATGRVTAMAVDPTNPNVVYEGGADGGVWKSTDGGSSWQSVGEQIATQSIGAIAIAPNAHDTLYVGTGEANTNGDSYFGYGIFKTTDGGSSWTKVGGTTFDKMTVFQIITKGTGGTVFAATNRGLYRSTDGGSTWTAVLVPGNPDHFDSFVTGVQWTYQTGRSMIAAVGYRGGRSTNGIYSSSDNGTTWTFLGSQSGFDAQSDLGRIALATTPGQNGLVYAAVQSVTLFNTPGAPTVFKGVYKSTNGAAGPWTEVESADQMAQNPTSALTPAHAGPGYQPGIQAWYNLYVSIDPTNPQDVMVGLEEVWNSRDGGSTWNVIGRYWDFCATPDQPWCYTGGAPSHYTTHPDQHAAGWGVTSNGTPVLYVGSDGGVWSQAGPNWSNDNWTNDNTNQSTTQCYSAAASADNTIICGLQDNGFVKYTGQSLWPAIAGGDGAEGAIDPSNSQNLMGSYVDMNIYESHNGGQTYTTISPPDDDPRFISPITMDPTDPTHIATVGQEVWETNKGFDTTTKDWHKSFNMKFPNQGTALSVQGSSLYVGACGP